MTPSATPQERVPCNVHVVIAICGASGAGYAVALLQHLLASGCEVSLLTSAAGRQVLRLEQQGGSFPAGMALGWADAPAELHRELCQYYQPRGGQLHCYAEHDFMAPVASGSAAADAMVVIPASMGIVGRLAAGVSNTLIERAADVMLKERRRLILVPRETPLHSIHLRNLLTLSEAGATILPAMPAFYHGVNQVQDLIDFIVSRVLDQLHIPHHLTRRWGDTLPDA